MRALNDEDFNEARKYLTDDFKFEGVMGSRDGGDAYMSDMSKMKFKYDIQKVFTEGDDVCIWYNINMGGPVILSAGLYTTVEGKINHLKVIFDPSELKK